MGSVDGKRMLEDLVTGSIERPEELGIDLAERLLNSGADEILAEVFAAEEGDAKGDAT